MAIEAVGGVYKVYAQDRIQVPHGRGGRVGRGGLQGVSQGQGSTAFRGADLVDIPFHRGLSQFSPK